MSTNKDYLGDSVYCDYDGYHLILTTENGGPNDPSNRICIDADVFAALERYVQRMKVKPTGETP